MKSHFFDADDVVDLITADHKVFNEEGDFLEQSFFAVLSFLLFKIVRKHMTYVLPQKKRSIRPRDFQWWLPRLPPCGNGTVLNDPPFVHDLLLRWHNHGFCV